MLNRILILIILLINTIYISTANSGSLDGKKEKGSERKLSAVAENPGWMPGEKAILNFEFDKEDELSGWVRQSGEWHLEGWIKHNSLRCGTYRLGMRFGKGGPACSNIKWITETKYASKRTQCNQTKMHHSGFESNTEISELYDEITCAQLVIQCTGICN